MVVSGVENGGQPVDASGDVEDVAEFSYQPKKFRRPYRVVVLRRHVSHGQGEICCSTEHGRAGPVHCAIGL
jgi:hypothetical protein